MSRSYPTQVEAVELGNVCPTCGADVDEWCNRSAKHWSGPGQYQTSLKVKAPLLHAARFELAIRAGSLPLR